MPYGYGRLIREARGDRSQTEFGQVLGYRNHVRVSRLESEQSPVDPETFELLVSRAGIDRLTLIEAMGYRLHLPQRDRIYGPLLRVLAEMPREAQESLHRTLQSIRSALPDQ